MPRQRTIAPALLPLLAFLGAGPSHAQTDAARMYFHIHVADEQTGRGVPLVELETTYNTRHYTDSAGNVAFFEPGLMNADVFFNVRSHGYEFPADGFGIRGVRLRTTPGAKAELKLPRMNIAERLYRITGVGTYRDTVLLGLKPPTANPLLNANVTGQDSVLNVIYRGKLVWIWGDTGRPAYPLGTFHAPMATSLLPAKGGLQPSVGVNLSYPVDEEGFARPSARLEGEGAVWMDGLVVLRDDAGREHMLATFGRMKSLAECLERGIVEYDDEQARFRKLRSFPVDAPTYPRGQPFRVASRDGQGEWFYFAQSFPLVRCRATLAAYPDIESCESYTCMARDKPGDPPRIDRDAEGRVRYAWRRGMPPADVMSQLGLIKDGALKPAESLFQTRDVLSGAPILIHYGSVYWNEHRQRWVMIAVQSMGASFLGEVWYLEADTPIGPWVYARKIVTHDKYSFYNPRRHVEFDEDGGRTMYFEGTYSQMFSGAPTPTPYYDYNQIMYRLDLGDERLTLPVAYYELGPGDFGEAQAVRKRADVHSARIAFFASDRPREGCVAVRRIAGTNGTQRLLAGEQGEVAFYAPPMDSGLPGLIDLYEYISGDGAATYATDPELKRAGLNRSANPVCRVWANPYDDAVRFDPAEFTSRGAGWPGESPPR